LDNETALNYFESLEGMLVQMQSATVVGPSDRDGNTWVVRSDLEIERVFDDDPQGTGEAISIGDAGLVSLNVGAKVSDQISLVYGVLTEEDTVYPVQLLSYPLITPGELPPNDQDAAGNTEFSLATANLYNLFDTYDDPNTADEIYTSVEYQRRLNKLALAIHGPLNEPDLLVAQEAENDGVLRDLALRPEIVSGYSIVWVDTPDPRGQDTALLYRPDKFAVLDYQTRQGCTALVDGLGPDGNQDVSQPSNSVTCDRDGDGVLDGNRLFSRPVLVVHLQAFNSPGRDGPPIELILVINHWKSKTEDTPEIFYTLQRRLEEAGFVARLVKDLESMYPAAVLVVAGDLNDVPGSEPVKKLDIPGLLDLTARVEKPRRYSLIYHGVSQVFDYIFIKPTIDLNASRISFQHINSDYPAGFENVAGTEQRSSDHDPLVVRFVRFTRFSYLPMIRLGK
jgi:predicted extracellular nuclease